MFTPQRREQGPLTAAQLVGSGGMYEEERTPSAAVEVVPTAHLIEAAAGKETHNEDN
jgi:hypothetical protein